ncbi:MAG: hypothetical protein IPM92_16780 [Saprospiraceae bacterium]|nr:hypothetical protein [Saprospiraceae bacterium]
MLFQLNSTYLLYTLPNGVVYGAALEGLIKLNPHAKIFNFNELKIENSQYSNQFHFSKIFEDTSHHSIYFATLFGNGFNVMNKKTGEIDNYPVDYSRVPKEKFMKVFDATQDDEGNIWVVGNTDVYEFKGLKKQLIKLVDPFQKEEQDSNYIVSRIIKDKDGTLWILTNKGGLHTFDPLKKKISPRLNNSLNKYKLPTYILKMECSPKGQIWLGSKTDIVYFDKENLHTVYIDNEVYHEKIKDGFSTMSLDTSVMLG